MEKKNHIELVRRCSDKVMQKSLYSSVLYSVYNLISTCFTKVLANMDEKQANRWSLLVIKFCPISWPGMKEWDTYKMQLIRSKRRNLFRRRRIENIKTALTFGRENKEKMDEKRGRKDVELFK